MCWDFQGSKELLVLPLDDCIIQHDLWTHSKKKKNNNFKKDSIENSKYLHGELCDNIK